MSSSDRDVYAVMSTADLVAPPMNDTTREEEEYYMNKRLWRHSKNDRRRVCYWRIILVLFPAILSLLIGLPLLIVGVWALVHGLRYFSIAAVLLTYAGFGGRVIIMSASMFTAVVIMGVAILLGAIAHILYSRFSGAQKDATHFKRALLISSVIFLLVYIMFLMITVGMALNVSETNKLFANNTFIKNYLDDQSIQETFDSIQHNLKCCGIWTFVTYESIFNNLSVPVSCCNTANPLANETTCPEIVSNARKANQTGLIYSEGCVSQLVSELRYILEVVIASSMLICMIGQLACILTCGITVKVSYSSKIILFNFNEPITVC